MSADAPYSPPHVAVLGSISDARSDAREESRHEHNANESAATDDVRDVAACRRGDRSAFGRLYSRYSRMVHGILLARVPYLEVDDLVQDVFLQALRHLTSLRSPAAFGGWVATIARRRAQDYFRRPRPEYELPVELESGAQPPSHEAAAALAAIRALPDAYRETLIMRLVEGMSGPEISARTGLTPGSVRVNLHRGMALLRKALGMEVQP